MNKPFLPPEWLFRIKAATRDLIARAGGIVRAGEVTLHGKSSVHRWGSPDHADVIPLTAALLLERETESALITRTLAELAGLRLEETGAPARPDLLASLGRHAAASAQLAATVVAAQSDGNISTNEAMEIARLAEAAQDAGADLKSAAATAAKGERQ